MAKSKVRGGAKQHRKKVEQRNQNLKGLWKKLSENAWKKHEEWKKQKELDANNNQDNEGLSGLNIAEQTDIGFPRLFKSE
jgi:mRNA-degrading endonuclease HigB of HigAB toxin-antitoxin module